MRDFLLFFFRSPSPGWAERNTKTTQFSRNGASHFPSLPITDPSQRRSSERAGDADVHTQLSNLIIQRVVLMGQTVEREVGSDARDFQEISHCFSSREAWVPRAQRQSHAHLKPGLLWGVLRTECEITSGQCEMTECFRIRLTCKWNGGWP